MIIADRKPLEETMEMVQDCGKVMLVGCNGCVTVCNVGGLKEVQILASTLRIARKKEGRPLEVEERVLERQCDPEYVEQLRNDYDQYDAVLSMACGVGPQFLSEAYPSQRFFPTVNTRFMGGAVPHGVREEPCAGCGGSAGGKWEVSSEIECIWDKSVRKKMENGRLADLRVFRPAKDWRTSRDGGPRRSIREELVK